MSSPDLPLSQEPAEPETPPRIISAEDARRIREERAGAARKKAGENRADTTRGPSLPPAKKPEKDELTYRSYTIRQRIEGFLRRYLGPAIPTAVPPGYAIHFLLAIVGMGASTALAVHLSTTRPRLDDDKKLGSTLTPPSAQKLNQATVSSKTFTLPEPPAAIHTHTEKKKEIGGSPDLQKVLKYFDDWKKQITSWKEKMQDEKTREEAMKELMKGDLFVIGMVPDIILVGEDYKTQRSALAELHNTVKDMLRSLAKDHAHDPETEAHLVFAMFIIERSLAHFYAISETEVRELAHDMTGGSHREVHVAQALLKCLVAEVKAKLPQNTFYKLTFLRMVWDKLTDREKEVWITELLHELIKALQQIKEDDRLFPRIKYLVYDLINAGKAVLDPSLVTAAQAAAHITPDYAGGEIWFEGGPFIRHSDEIENPLEVDRPTGR